MSPKNPHPPHTLLYLVEERWRGGTPEVLKGHSEVEYKKNLEMKLGGGKKRKTAEISPQE